jgi:hypothetical protein
MSAGALTGPADPGELVDADPKHLCTGLRVRTPQAPRRGEEGRATPEHEATAGLAMRPLPLAVAQAPCLDGDPVVLAERTTQDDEVALVHHRSWLFDDRPEGVACLVTRGRVVPSFPVGGRAGGTRGRSGSL